MVTQKKNGRRRLPKMGRHSSGQARVTLNGRVYYLGLHGTVDAQKRYADLLTKWTANGRQPLEPVATVVQARKLRDVLGDYRAYLQETGRYQKGGKPTSQRHIVNLALDELAGAYGDVLASKVSDAILLRHRDELERRVTLSRPGINRKMAHVRRALRWAWQRGILTRDQWLSASAIEPLRRSELGGREGKRGKRAVSTEDIEAVADASAPVVAAMLRLQAAIGCRPGEVCGMKWCDIAPEPVDVDGVPCRVYVVAHAKNEHHGKGATTYAMPPSVVAMLGTPSGPSDYVFRVPGTQRPYGVHGYREAVVRACARATVPPFSPHQVRHGFLTRAAQRYGVLAASAAANHSSTSVTQSYLHRDRTDGYRCVVGLAVPQN